MVSFEIDEDLDTWPGIRDWVKRRRAVDVPWTEFSLDELADAQWLQLVGDWHYGYPQPDENGFGYLEATYDLTDWCRECGVGGRQRAPFQMRGEPKWGRRSILQLNWVFDEYLVTPQAWSQVFRPWGVECRAVNNTKGIELKTVVQLVVSESVGIVPDGLASERCHRCGRIKYLPVSRGPFPALAERPMQHMARTKEYFGSGGQAFKGVIVSQALARNIRNSVIRGALLRPVRSPVPPLAFPRPG